MSDCKRLVLLGCLVGVACRERPEDYASETAGIFADAGAAPAASRDASSTSDAADGDAASDASADAMRADGADTGPVADASATTSDAQLPVTDTGVSTDASADSGSDASLSDAATTSDAAASNWPSGCTVYRIAPPDPIEVPAETVHVRDIVLPAPWGSAQAQALEFRSLPDSPALREMSLQTGGGAPLALSGPQPVASPLLPVDVGMYLPSGASSLRLRLQYDSHGRGAGQDRSGFEVCVVTGTSRRAKTAAFVAVSPSTEDVPPMVQDFELSGRCRLHLSQPVQLLAVQPFARKRAVSTRLALETSDPTTTTTVIHQGAYSSADPKLSPLATPITISDGGELVSGCTYSNPSDQSYSFGGGLEDEACANFLLHVPRGAFNCTLED